MNIKSTIIKFISLVCALCMSSAVMNATPAYPHPVKVTQPDGSVITIRIHGDEFLNWITCGDELVTRGSDGFFHYASFSTSGATKSSGTRVRSTSPGDGSSIKPPASAVSAAMAKRAAAVTSPSGSISLGTGKKFLVLLIEFSNLSFTVSEGGTSGGESSRQAFSNSLNRSYYSHLGATGSAREYFEENSHGRFSGQFDVFGPIRVSKTWQEYGAGNGLVQSTGAPALLKEACDSLSAHKEQYGFTSFADYDMDSNGIIDNVFFYYAGYNSAEGATGTIWPHSWRVLSQPEYDGKRLYGYACTSELTGTEGGIMSGIGTFCHEFGHVLGLPDLYDTDDAANGQANALWNTALMCSGNYNNEGRTPPYLTYEERRYLGWDDGLTLVTEGTNELQPISSGMAYYFPTDNQNEYFLLESRPASRWDAYLNTEGLAIYHVDKSNNTIGGGYTAAWTWQNKQYINVYGDHPCMDLIETVPEDKLSMYMQLLYPGIENVTSFTASTVPSSRGWSGNPTGYSLRNISHKHLTGVTSVDITFSRTISGIVSDSHGRPIQGASVKISQEAVQMTGSLKSGSFSSIIRTKGDFVTDVISAVTGSDGSFSVDLEASGTYSIDVTKNNYSSYSDIVTVKNGLTLNICLTSMTDQAGTTLKKYNLTSNLVSAGAGVGTSLYAAVGFPQSQLTECQDADITGISFLALNGGAGSADKVGVRVYFDTELMCDVEAPVQIYGSMNYVDISSQKLKIPSDRKVYICYYIINPAYGFPIGATNPSADPVVTDGCLVSLTGDGTWYSNTYGNNIISATVTKAGNVFDTYGINYMNLKPSYTSGEAITLSIKESSVNPPSSVSWKVNGLSKEDGSQIILESGKTYIQITLTYPSGRTEIQRMVITAE